MHDFDSRKCKYNNCNLETVGSELEMRWTLQFGDLFVEDNDKEVIEARESVQFSFDKPFDSVICINQQNGPQNINVKQVIHK